MAAEKPFKSILKSLEKPDGGEFGKYYSLPALNDPRVDKLPYSIKILLESAICSCDEFQMVQVWHVSSSEHKKRRKPMTPVTSKIKKYKIKGYLSYKSRLLNDGTIRRWREGKRHNAHLKLHVTKSNDEQQCKAQFVKSQLCNFHKLWSTVPEDSSHCHSQAQPPL